MTDADQAEVEWERRKFCADSSDYMANVTYSRSLLESTDISSLDNRTFITGFIDMLNFHIENGLTVPMHFTEFAARLLSIAVDVTTNSKAARDNPLAKAIGLSGRLSNEGRDYTIAVAVHYCIGEDQRFGKNKFAYKKVSKYLAEYTNISLESRAVRHIYGKVKKVSESELDNGVKRIKEIKTTLPESDPIGVWFELLQLT